jgi:monoamine oxidase
MCKSIPLEAPWEAKNAEKWDQTTLAKWLAGNTVSKAAHDLLETAIAGCYRSAASEVSMLFVAYQMASGGGPGSCSESRTLLAAPVSTGTAHRPGRRRRDRAL